MTVIVVAIQPLCGILKKRDYIKYSLDTIVKLDNCKFKTMKTRIINSIVPPIMGILTVLILLIGGTLLFTSQTSLTNLFESDKNFYLYLVPATILIGIIIQFALILPILKRLKNNKKIIGLKLIPFTIIISVIAGLAIGFLFWETRFGTTDLLYGTLAAIIAFAIYWTINLLTVQFFDSLFKSKEKKYATYQQAATRQ